ncbi:MAG TPA: hypothetical protein VF293_03495, partial [Candidatus Limnocylindrales bacterium]
MEVHLGHLREDEVKDLGAGEAADLGVEVELLDDVAGVGVVGGGNVGLVDTRTIVRMIVRMRRIAESGPQVAYQATDLARHHRAVIDAARSGQALLRDKDGTALVLAPAADIERTYEIAELALELIRARQAVDRETGQRSAGLYGDLAWLSVLPDEVQRRCLDELAEALLVASSGMSLRPVDLLLGDWRATTEAWADPDTRE